ncbi:MAG: hypothetical protein IBJ12_08490 [Sphingomonadaceae bacterium]|nr:hypothetical protein [Sphingomonadaceae bacterium]
MSAANGLNQLLATTPGSGQTSVTSLGYDGRGNLTSSGSNIYAYTSENRLASAPSGVSMRYDLGGRLWQLSQGAATTRFDYAGSALLAETDGAGTVLRRYVHGPATDEPIVQYEGAGLTNRRFFTSDERGSIIAVTDARGYRSHRDYVVHNRSTFVSNRTLPLMTDQRP